MYLCHLPEVELAIYQAGFMELCLEGIELATSTSITGGVTTNPVSVLCKHI